MIDSAFEDYQFDIVVNLATQAGVCYSITNLDAYINSNIIGFCNILEACRHSHDNGAKGVGSERHAYIDHGTGQFVDEDARTLVGLMVKAVTTKDASYTLESVYNSAP